MVFLLSSWKRHDTNYTSWEVFKEEIKRDIKNPDDDFEVTSVIRSRIAQLIDLPCNDSLDIDVLYPDNHSFTLNRFVDIFKNDSAGAICATTAFILKKVYNDFGYECTILSLGGNNGTVGHVTCLVKINYNGEKITVVQDATFNFTIVDTTGAPADYNEMTAMLNRGQNENLVLRTEQTYCDFLVDGHARLPRRYHTPCTDQILIVKSATRRLKQRMPKTLDFLWMNCGKLGHQCLDEIEQRGYSRNILNLFLVDPVVID